MNHKNIYFQFWILLLVFFSLFTLETNIFAKENSVIEGQVYQQEDIKNYDLSKSNDIHPDNELETIGQFILNGNTDNQSDNQYYIKEGHLNFLYELDKEKLTALKDQWQVVEDKNKKIGKLKLDQPIMNGAIIVQSSFDGEDWQTDKIITDILSKDTDLSKPFFTTNQMHEINGAYYRILVTYKLERESEPTDLIIFDIDNTETKYQFEEYKFYAINKKTVEEGNASPSDKPRREFKSKVNTGLDNGYNLNEAEKIDKEDPHFGWDLGFFTVNGYTREAKESNGKPVFLKTVGDEIRLWFTLNQEIDQLDKNPALRISEDKNGYDVAMGIKQTNFKRGTLIVKYTDDEGHNYDPVIYTDFLAANASTYADTRIQLFEEGDYEVTLNYEVSNSPRRYASVDVLPKYYNYKMNFEFAIRNGNTMAFPRDMETGSELKDRAYTRSGFIVDFTQSKYLTLDVVRKEVITNDDGSLSSSVRSNTVGNGLNTYDKPGIYELTVKNQYSESLPTTITIFVGEDKNIMALAKNKLSIEEFNQSLLAGKEIDDSGEIVDQIENDSTEEKIIKTESSVETSADKNKEVDTETTQLEVKVSENKESNIFLPTIGIVGLMIIGWMIFQKRKF
ncbi:hypothetical protein [Facklamia sp. 7083-14-GEN3]|uniref:hypothetical protein n=1 Tax=Facklamia sp. 7083-14-GEN3 TaxID=2973478 RepID=UPI00215BEF03|nr:hypothetical protein [Facklamia sp. 7083-14-GEN3]MCR8968441.1 hypothetical protein [Facklamia sp. 7083-14-GEN3]